VGQEPTPSITVKLTRSPTTITVADATQLQGKRHGPSVVLNFVDVDERISHLDFSNPNRKPLADRLVLSR
jgi:hypothetical protein